MTPQQRRLAIQRMPNLIADSYESPRHSVQSILTQIVAQVTDLQRRSA